ncbi:FlgB family protein [Rhodophyticola sp. CCM32]|uniref:FlgB family protein n=1 Tax=Rhodophyticola sp. CCM32 TaxID=2916397 RepID=UPI00107F3BBA|nr:FlgB family protein [Rhodophyticola sp. CCM32]QBY02213.1 FlgB family protein [Rhodophyticola sp. CCM32]
MFDNLEIFGLAQARARHAAARQTVVATNVANADTPGYRAQDIAAFEDVFHTGTGAAARPVQDADFTTYDASGPASPNGNTVSLETEMLRSVEAQRAHSRALSIYQSALRVLRTSIGH